MSVRSLVGWFVSRSRTIVDSKFQHKEVNVGSKLLNEPIRSLGHGTNL